MSYIVPNSNKPVRCNRCPFIDADSLNCTLMEDSYKYIELACQHIHCPLIELPPHGRLGDLDVLTEDLAIYRGGHSEGWGYDGGMYEAYNNSLMLVEDAPTIIEAERGETDA